VTGAPPLNCGVRRLDTRLDGMMVDTYTVRMDDLRFVWDDRKNLANRKKHGVSFEEARTAFLDENAKVYSDPDHSRAEDRFILLGISLQLRVLVVCHCCREGDSVVRIISARRADKAEQEDYWRLTP
jgi:uncharacterized DUF497 family protein